MLTQERQSEILNILKNKKTVTVSDLTKQLGASESTIRRDLLNLHNLGKLNKVHGGATILEDDIHTFEYDVPTKSLLNTDEKKIIGKYAASLINDDDFVYIDAGTTTEHLIDYIENVNATFVTNGIAHAKKLIQKGLKAYMVGGQIKPSTEAVIGAEAISNIKKYNFTKCFMGTNGIDVKRGYTTPDIEESLVKSEAINQSYMAYILADKSKFSKISSVSFSKISKACIITDSEVDKIYHEYTVIKEAKE